MSTHRFLPPDTGYREPSEVISRIKNVLYFIIGAAAAIVFLELWLAL